MISPSPKALPANPRIIFMGTPDFAVPALKALVEFNHQVLGVVTQPDRPKGRGRKLVPCPVKQVAISCGLPIFQPERASDPAFCEAVRRLDPDLLVVVAFGQILTKALLEIPRCGAVNIHASLLPKYRGAAPIQWAILNNEANTGLTAMRLDEGLDTGPILLQMECAISQNETAGQLHDRLARASGEFLINTLAAMAENRIAEMPQHDPDATYAPKIHKGLSLIHWNQAAEAISALIRGLDPWPGAYTTYKGERVKIFSSQVLDDLRTDGFPGRVAGVSDDGIRVETGKGVINIRELQIAGKRRLPAGDFVRGFSVRSGAVLGE